MSDLSERISKMIDRMQGNVFKYFELAIGDRRLAVYRSEVFKVIQDFKRYLLALLRESGVDGV